MWAAAGAWFTFYAAMMTSRTQNQNAVMNLIAGLEAELELITFWASGADEDLGYLQLQTAAQLAREHEDWFNPSRQIFRFEAPALEALTTSPQLSRLTPLIKPLVRLNYSIRRVFDLHSELRTFAVAHPHLYKSVVRKLSAKTPVKGCTQDEQVYMEHIFGMNRKIHQELIGGTDSTDDFCLYKSFRCAKTAIATFKKELRPEPVPWWYLLLHLSAGFLALNGMWQILRWFDVPTAFRHLMR